MTKEQKVLFHGVIDGVLDYLKSGYTYGYRADHKDCFYCLIDAYKEDYTCAEEEDDYVATINFSYGFYDAAVDEEESSDTNFAKKGELDIYCPNIFAAKTPEQIHDIVYGMILTHMQNIEE